MLVISVRVVAPMEANLSPRSGLATGPQHNLFYTFNSEYTVLHPKPSRSRCQRLPLLCKPSLGNQRASLKPSTAEQESSEMPCTADAVAEMRAREGIQILCESESPHIYSRVQAFKRNTAKPTSQTYLRRFSSEGFSPWRSLCIRSEKSPVLVHHACSEYSMTISSKVPETSSGGKQSAAIAPPQPNLGDRSSAGAVDRQLFLECSCLSDTTPNHRTKLPK